MTPKNSLHIVLVHGAFVDGSGWEGVYRILRADGYKVSVAQHTTQSVEGDVAAVKLILDSLDGPALLVGHSYGGVVITEAGNHPKVEGLVYVAALAPDKGESAELLTTTFPPDAPVAPILPPQQGYLSLDKAKFHASFGADVDEEKAAFMADSQLPWGIEAVTGKIGEPAWKKKPSWFVVAAEDRMIPPQAQRAMAKRAGSTVVEETASHVVFISKPKAVASVIVAAAKGIHVAA